MQGESAGQELELSTPPLRVKGKSKDLHRISSASTVKMGESKDSLPTDACLKRATTLEQQEASNAKRPRVSPRSGSSADKKKNKEKPAHEEPVGEVFEESPSPVNPKSLGINDPTPDPKRRKTKAPADASQPSKIKPPAKADAKAKSRPPAIKTPSAKASGTAKAKASATTKAKGNKPQAKAKEKSKAKALKPKEVEEHEPDEVEDEDEKPEEKDKADKVSAKAKEAHKLYMRYWRNLRSLHLSNNVDQIENNLK